MAQARTFALVSFPWLFFRAASLEDAAVLLSRIFTGWGGVPAALEAALPLILPLVCLPNTGTPSWAS